MNGEATTTRVCIYTRISTDEENQPTSLGSQEDRLRAFCKVQEGWRVVAHHPDRATGTKLDRPGLQAALDLAREGRVDMLLVYRVDRLSRKVRQLASLAEELDACNVILRSATEPFDTGSPAGRMMLQMLAVFAEFEHATIVDRISAGIERRAKEGRWYSGRPPFGYILTDGQLFPDPVTAPIVGRVYALYVQNQLGTTAIATMLREEGVFALTAGWSHQVVHRILTNPTYLGRVRWRELVFDSTHEPLIDQDTFDKAQAILAERGADMAQRRSNPSDFLLSGLIRCGKCGHAYIGMAAHGKGGKYHYYSCTGRKKYGSKTCENDRLPSQCLEDAVFAQLADIYRDGTLITEAIGQAREDAERHRPEDEQRLSSIRAEIARSEQALERYYQAFEQGSLPAERCQARTARLDARLEELRTQEAELSLQAPQDAAPMPTRDELGAVAGELERVIATAPATQTKALLRILIAGLRVNGKDDIRPTYRVTIPDGDAPPLAGVRPQSGKVETVGVEPTSAIA
jgi:site-specific DNA recombinase